VTDAVLQAEVDELLALCQQRSRSLALLPRTGVEGPDTLPTDGGIVEVEVEVNEVEARKPFPDLRKERELYHKQ
jgi:hypothetical protein